MMGSNSPPQFCAPHVSIAEDHVCTEQLDVNMAEVGLDVKRKHQQWWGELISLGKYAGHKKIRSNLVCGMNVGNSSCLSLKCKCV